MPGAKYNHKVEHRSSHPEVFLGKGVLKIGGKFTGDTHTEVGFE